MLKILKSTIIVVLLGLLAISNGYSQTSALESATAKFRKNNEIQAISVAIIKDGEMIFKYGEGNVGNGKTADGDTVYPAASVSKVFAGTLAVRLWQEKKLRDGTKVDLDFNRTTASYLQNIKQTRGATVTIPNKHRHTVKQLFSHLACIKHYKNDSPEYVGKTPAADVYPKAIDALPSIWNEDFVPGCVRGETEEYSTHAFTYIAAVLEQVTGRTSAELIHSEIAVPYDLPTLRATWNRSRIVNIPNRAVLYDENNRPVKLWNNSWKVLGGGLEISTADLARFGWKVRNGEIVRRFHLDTLLWKKIGPSDYGMAWKLNRRNRWRVAEHSGKWRGIRTNLRVYRDKNAPLVIAVMTNREFFKEGNLNTLTDELANIVLKVRRIR